MSYIRHKLIVQIVAIQSRIISILHQMMTLGKSSGKWLFAAQAHFEFEGKQ